MCDTLLLRKNGISWFAKNSDREPDEPQALVWIAPVENDGASTVRCTYIEVPQQARRHGVLLSQPQWIWGGEIGVNTAGVAIGNEAVFSRLVDRKGQALLGMDLLRLGLERGSTAREALDTITAHLVPFGQAGPAGYQDKGFRYDNSFLIADALEAWVLETAGHMWVAKRVDTWAISNCYSLHSDFDLCSANLQEEARRLGYWNGHLPFDFAKAFDTRLYAFVGGAHRRRALNAKAIACELQPGWTSMAARLRDHGQHTDDFASHDNRQVCLHAGSMLRPSQTTASLIARLAPGQVPQVVATGTSAPCLSLFQPVPLGTPLLNGLSVQPGAKVQDTAWFAFEPVHHRALFDPLFRAGLARERDALEAQWMPLDDGGNAQAAAIAQQAAAWRSRWHAQATASTLPPSGRLARWWHKRALHALASAEDTFR